MRQRPTKMTRLSDENSSAHSFSAHPPPFQRCGPRELPETRARDLKDRFFTGISFLNQFQATMQDSSSASSSSRNRMRDQEPCLLSASMQRREVPTAVEDGIQDHPVSLTTSIPQVSYEPLPSDVCIAALRTTEAWRVLDKSFSSLCNAIKSYNKAVRCETHLRVLHGLPFSP